MGAMFLRMRRATVYAVALLLLLILHHPLMGVMPSPDASMNAHRAVDVATTMMSGPSNEVSDANADCTSPCPPSDTSMPCPLMSATTPHRASLLAPPRSSGTGYSVATPFSTHTPSGAARVWIPTVDGQRAWVPAARVRRAILQIYLL